jgi:hypothetical protein
MMNGTRLDTLARAPINSGNGSLSRIVKTPSPAADMSSIAVASAWPNVSRAIHRRSEAMHPRTLAPS